MSEIVFKRKTLVIEDEDEEMKINKVIPNQNKDVHKKENPNQKKELNKNKTSDQRQSNSNSSKINPLNKKAGNSTKPSEMKMQMPLKNSSSDRNQSPDTMLKKKKKPESSSSSSNNDDNDDSNDDSSSSSSNSSDSDSSDSKKKNGNKKKKSTTSGIKRQPTNYKENKETNKKKTLVLKTKESLVHQFLKRWWYSFQWPNKDNYSSVNIKIREELRNHNLRKVEVTDWRVEREVDEKGMSKCIELSGFNGVFRDSKGTLYDFRPKDMCPSYNNFMKKDEKFIYDHLIKALREQISTLEKTDKYSNQDEKFLHSLKEELELTIVNYKKLY